MDIKLGGLGAKVQALNRISAQQVSAVFAWKITKMHKKLLEEAQEFEKSRIALCVKYASKDEKGEPVLQVVDGRQQYVGVEGNEKFNEELFALMNIPVEFDIKPLDITQLEKEGIKLSVQDVYDLDNLINEPEEETKDGN